MTGTSFVWAGCAVVVLGASSVCAAPRVTAEDYARAERFLPWNSGRYVVNGELQHHWIAKTDRFWYRRVNPAGQDEVVVVDAATGKETVSADRLNSPSAGPRNELVSPDGSRAAFLRDYNIWIRAGVGGKEFPLTQDGTRDYSYASRPGYSTHSVSDIRQHTPRRPQAIWSPDSRYLLTYRLDERTVKESFLIQSVPEDGGTRPELFTYRYAMPGDAQLPKLELVVLNVTTGHRVDLITQPLVCQVFTLLEKHDAWWSTDSESLYYLDRDRFSKSVSLYRANPQSGAVKEVLHETSSAIVYNNANNVFDFPLVRTLENGSVIWYSQRDGWGHLYYYDATGKLRNQITSGDWAVRGIAYVDEPRKIDYFTASGREAGEDLYQQHLYSVRLNGSGIKLLTPENADHDLHIPTLSDNDDPSMAQEVASFSASGRYFVDTYSTPDAPPTFVLRTADGRLIRRLEQADISRLVQGGYTRIEPFHSIAADRKTLIYGNLFRPSTFDPSKRYPVIDSIYPGPQTIRTRKGFMAANFDELEAQSLAELGFIVVTLDGRGTPNRSRGFLDYAYGRLQHASELEDHIAGIRQLAERFSYIDANRVGIDGKSGGGYAAAHAILAYPEFFKVAVAAQGNHDSRGYVASWGETYNGPIGEGDYEGSSNEPLAGNLEGHLLLIHGEMDDNVSPSLTLGLVDALIKANKTFDLLIIPNGNHFVWKSPYFIRRKWDYFVRYLLDAEPPADYRISQPQ